jgi:hypothetical protein
MAEIALGFLSYFSEWKEIIVLIGVVVIALAGYAWRTALPPLIAGASALLFLGTIWTVIKPDYRVRLAEGQRQQVVTLSRTEQGAVLTRQISNVDSADIPRGFLDLLARLSYVDYLADVLRTVPTRVEHQQGALWAQALGQFLTPRFLFPDKPPLPSDSERTMQFTGRTMASTSEGTSISIGYVGESYIDFGIAGALVISFLLGSAYSLSILCLAMLNRGRDGAILVALAIPLVWTAQQFEISNIKLVGSLAWTFAACLVTILTWPSARPLLLGNVSVER